MSRTRHLTQADAQSSARATRRRARTRLTKLGGLTHLPSTDRPKNAGNHWRPGYNAGQRRRKERQQAKIVGRRLERRRLNREIAA